MLEGTSTMDFDAWFVVSLTNIPYNACTLTTGYELDEDGVSSKCTLNVNVTYCGLQNSTDVYEFLIIKSQSDPRHGKLRQRREIKMDDGHIIFLPWEDVEDPVKSPDKSLITTIKNMWGDPVESSGTSPAVVVNELEDLLNTGNLSIASVDVHNLLDRVDGLLHIDREEKIPGELLHGLDRLGTRFKLERNQNASIARGNVALLAVESTPSLHLRGTRVAAAHDVFADDSLQLITGENEDALQMTDKNDAVVFLPESVTRVERRISLVAFRTSTPFVSDHNCQDCQLNSKVISINVENYTSLEDGEMIRIYLSPSKRVHHRNQTRVCAYWHFHENGTGFWSQEGCTITKASQKGMLDLCECNHLTHFAEILIHKDVFSESDENTLEIISIIGCCFSLFGISVIVLTAALFKSWRQNNSNKIWLNLGSAVFILDVCFLLTVFVDFDDHITGCVVVGVALHYSVLATFCWMLVVSILSFRKLVLVFTSELPCKLLITVLFAWGLPFLVIGILLAVDSNAYSGRFEDTTPSGKFCYPKGVAFWVSVFGPMAVMWLVNWILYALILRSMFAGKTNIRKHTSSKDTLRCASISCLLAFLCGIPWVFGFFAHNIVAAYLFSITVTFQGFVLFLFFILGNKKTRGLWLSMFMKRSRRAVITTSTDRSNKGRNTARSFFPISSPLAPDEASGSLLSETRL